MLCHQRIITCLTKNISIVSKCMPDKDIIEGNPHFRIILTVIGVDRYCRDNLCKRPRHTLAQLVRLSQSNFCPNHRPLILQGVVVSCVFLFSFNGKFLEEYGCGQEMGQVRKTGASIDFTTQSTPSVTTHVQ